MGSQVLQMKYHPAMKEVRFRYLLSGENQEFPRSIKSTFNSYMNEKGKFVLQDRGNDFLKDIAELFSGWDTGNIEVITTRKDYEDFEKMVKFFNKNSGIRNFRIETALTEPLRDMDEIYGLVKDYGEKSAGILLKHGEKFSGIETGTPGVKKIVDDFRDAVKKEVDSIQKKIDAMAENNVNLCFAGVYSSGKSSLINALLGYRILPEANKAETSRMFRIQSPAPGEKVRIEFKTLNEDAKLVWNGKVFEFTDGPAGAVRKNVQDIIDTHSGEPRHVQIYKILEVLNGGNEDGDGENGTPKDIRVYFPIPIDNGKVRFTIYDTPGTDANNTEHKETLQKALTEQTYSVLVFVIHPQKTQGEGNNALLNYLKEAEQKDSKTSIDISRSLFVVNFADIINLKTRTALQKDVITKKDDPGFSVKLSDKRLLFTSAMVGYAVKAQKNKIATEEDINAVEDNETKVKRERYYRQNRCAGSEYSTELMIEESDREAEKEGESLYVCSGLFALENEIIRYGEKDAPAVRAYAIINSVGKALSAIKNKAKILETDNERNKESIDREIESLRTAVSEGVKQAYAMHSFPPDKPLAPDILRELKLTPDDLNNSLVGEPLRILKKKINWWFIEDIKSAPDKLEKFLDATVKGITTEKIKGDIKTALDKLKGIPGNVKEIKLENLPGKLKDMATDVKIIKILFDDRRKLVITRAMTDTVTKFTDNFIDKRRDLIEKRCASFIETVKDIIGKNGELSERAKSVVFDISPPDIDKPSGEKIIGPIYDKNNLNFLFINILDEKKFIKGAEGELMSLARLTADSFQNDFRTGLDNTLKKVEQKFNDNLVDYSMDMQTLLQEKEAADKLREKITEAVNDLEARQTELEEIIWSKKQ